MYHYEQSSSIFVLRYTMYDARPFFTLYDQHFLYYFLEVRVRFLVCIVTRHGHALAVPKKVARVLARHRVWLGVNSGKSSQL